MYTDTHFHYQEMRQRGISDGFVSELFDGNTIRYAVDVSIRGDLDYAARRNALNAYPQIFFTIGFHPGQTGSVDPAAVADRLGPYCRDERIIAVGETGLDTYRDFGTLRDQRELFQAQIELANHFELPIVVHCRQAAEQVLDVLRTQPPQAGGVIHCFEADTAAARQFLDLGMHISFAGNRTFKRNEELRETAAYIPNDRLLLETDSPFLTPVPHRGKPNHPGMISHTYEAAAHARNTSVEQLSSLIRQNTEQLFGIIPV